MPGWLIALLVIAWLGLMVFAVGWDMSRNDGPLPGDDRGAG